MRAIKIIVNALVICIALPVFIVGLLGLALSPLQAAAQTVKPIAVMESSDILLDDDACWETDCADAELTLHDETPSV